MNVCIVHTQDINTFEGQTGIILRCPILTPPGHQSRFGDKILGT